MELKDINFIIPANDDSPKSIRYVVQHLQECAIKGQEEYNKKKRLEKLADKQARNRKVAVAKRKRGKYLEEKGERQEKGKKGMGW